MFTYLFVLYYSNYTTKPIAGKYVFYVNFDILGSCTIWANEIKS